MFDDIIKEKKKERKPELPLKKPAVKKKPEVTLTYPAYPAKKLSINDIVQVHIDTVISALTSSILLHVRINTCKPVEWIYIKGKENEGP